MAKPAVIEARKARALEAMQEQLDRIESKLDAVLRCEPLGPVVELKVELDPKIEQALAEQAEASEPQPAPEKGKGKNK